MLSILYAAKKYMVQGLEKLCRTFLDKELCPANVWPVLDQVNNERHFLIRDLSFTIAAIAEEGVGLPGRNSERKSL